MMGQKMALGHAQSAQAAFLGYLNILSRHVFVGFLCEPKHKTDCESGHDIDGKDMLYYIIVQCLNRLGLAGEDFSSRRHVGNLMLRKNAIAFAMMLAVSSAGMVFAGDIYKWTDEDGNVHYGDRPTSEVSEEPLAVSSGFTDPSKVQARYEAKAAAIEPAEPTPEELRPQALEVAHFSSCSRACTRSSSGAGCPGSIAAAFAS